MIEEYVAKSYMKKRYGSSDRHLINENMLFFYGIYDAYFICQL